MGGGSAGARHQTLRGGRDPPSQPFPTKGKGFLDSIIMQTALAE